MNCCFRRHFGSDFGLGNAARALVLGFIVILAACTGPPTVGANDPPTAPTISAQPENQSVTMGATATFSVTATGTAPLSFQWSKNGTAIGGATDASYTTPAAVAGDDGATFSVDVTNPTGHIASNSAILTVTTAMAAPSITTQPANQSVTVGATASFSVTASGTAPLSYQWSKNNTPISGATSSTYTTPATVVGDDGATFTVEVLNGAGTVVSLAATLTVTSAAVAPSIVTQPADQMVAVGAKATFTVQASGTAPLTYQWSKNGAAIAGATASSYTTPATVIADNGASYSVQITNSAGNVTSNAATLTVNNIAPSISAQPKSQTVNLGATATFVVTATGTSPLTFQWLKNGIAISGASASSYTTPATVVGDDGATFSVRVTNGAGNILSSNATLTVKVTAPAITAQPQNQSVLVGGTAAFSVTATGTAPLTYQWSKNGTAIGGATAASYTTPATVIADNGAKFTVKVTNSAGNVTSSAATLTVTSAATAPRIVSQPANQSVTVGAAATFTVTASGTAPLTYQWSKGGAAIGGATGASYTTPATVLVDSGTSFTVKVTNSAGNITSSAAILTVKGITPTITAQPQNQSVVVGRTATFSVSASGIPTPTYQWLKNGTKISGATGPTYTTPVTVILDSGATFAVVATNSVGSVTSNPATLTVTGIAPTITTQPHSQTVTAGATAAFSVTATGTPTPTFQWSKNGAGISGATNATYTTPATVSTDNGASFTVKVSNTAGSIISSPAILTVNSPPTITLQPQNQSVTVGATARFSVAATGSGTLTYQWSKNAAPISGATAASYTTPGTVSGDNGATFTVKVSNAYGNAPSNAAILTVSAAGAGVTVTPMLAPLTISQTQQFTASVTSNWSIVGFGNGNATVGTITSSGLYTPGTAVGTYTIEATSTSDSSQTGTATVAVTDLGGIYSYHNEAAASGHNTNEADRTGQNTHEFALTAAVLKSGNFGKVWSCPVDGAVYAQPLYVANLSFGANGTHNVVFIATEHDSVYAFDADRSDCHTYWILQLATNGETSVPAADTSCFDTPVEIGITGTPVIDPVSQTLYFVAKTKASTGHVQRLHAVSLTTGNEKFGGPVAIAATGTTPFDALVNHQKAGLALSNNHVYIGWASHCDQGDYTGWFMSYDAQTLVQTSVLAVTPNTFRGKGGIWMSGGAPAVDSSNNVYFSTGNGNFNNNQTTGSLAAPLSSPTNLGMSFVKFDPTNLAPLDFYTPGSWSLWSSNDLDISSSGVTVLPNNAGPPGHPNLLFGSDKQDNLWLLDRDNMGGFSTFNDNSVQHIQGPQNCQPAGDQPSCVFSTPGYYNKTIYLGVAEKGILAIPMTNGTIGVTGAQSADAFGFPGPTPTISAPSSASLGAVVWGLDTSQNGTRSTSRGPALLRAYDATNLANRLYTSSAQADDAGPTAVKFAVPTVANGRVYVGGIVVPAANGVGGTMTVYGPCRVPRSSNGLCSP